MPRQAVGTLSHRPADRPRGERPLEKLRDLTVVHHPSAGDASNDRVDPFPGVGLSCGTRHLACRKETILAIFVKRLTFGRGPRTEPLTARGSSSLDLSASRAPPPPPFRRVRPVRLRARRERVLRADAGRSCSKKKRPWAIFVRRLTLRRKVTNVCRTLPRTWASPFRVSKRTLPRIADVNLVSRPVA